MHRNKGGEEGGGGGGGGGRRGKGAPTQGDIMASSSSRQIGLQIGSAWFQRKINLRPQHRGVHLVTEEILRQIPELAYFSVGLCHVQSKLHPRYISFYWGKDDEEESRRRRQKKQTR